MDIMLSLQGLGSFLLYFAAGIAAEAIFVALYIAVTPHREPTLIKAGNTAAAVSLGGAVLGFTLPLASAIANSVAIVDMAVWSGVALVVQLSVFLLASLLLRVSRAASRRAISRPESRWPSPRWRSGSSTPPA